jgi:two-component system NarL family sensor kinase
VVAVLHPATHGTKRADITFAQGLYVLWVGAAAVLLSSLLSSRRQRIVDLAAARGRLVAQSLDAEEHARKRLSDELHDHAIQNVLTARQDLADAAAGDGDALT